MISYFDGSCQKRKSKSVSSFIVKTYDLLNDAQNHRIIRWAQNGIGFVVLNEDQFAKTILPKYFKHSNYSSFVRQLNMYNFHKIRQTNGESYFHHQHFDRNNRGALTQIKRKPEKKKRKLLGENDEDSEELGTQTPKHELHKENTGRKVHKVDFTANQTSQRQISQQSASISVSQKADISNKLITTTKQLFSSQFTIKFQNPISESASDRKLAQNCWEADEQNEDKISINNDIQERMVPTFPTKEFMYPSKNNLFPFGSRVNKQFDVFF